MIGTTLGHYRVVARLGAGAMGEVYQATDTKLGRDVALKVLPAELSADADRLERFQREARALAALDHPGIVSVYSVEEAGGVHFLTMQLVEGQPLDRLIAEGGLPVERLLEIGAELADALAAAHAKGIIHRDLKPANVMVGDDRRVRILDFGLAKIAAPEDPESSDSQLATQAWTRDGVVMGTVPYMSPEQVTGAEASPLSDIFSLGVILFETATGRRPFGGRSSAELASSILRDPPPPLGELRSDLPGDLNALVLAALAKETSQRIQTAQAVREALQSLRRRLDTGETPESRSPPGSAAADAGPSVAVLPFENRSADPENEYFSDGLAEEIMSVLAQIKGLRVAARTSSFYFKGKTADIAEIGEKLHVANVLEGSVRRSGNRVRVTVQLVDVSNGYQLWSERYDRQMEDIFDVQEDIARAIAKRLEVALSGGRSDPLVKVPTRNMEAYELYLKGRALLLKRGHAVAAGGVCLRRAVELDPKMSAAWAGLADMNTIQGYWGMAPHDEVMPRALEAAQRAVALDSTSAEAHSALATATLLWERDYATAEREFRRALDLNPGDIQGRCWYALFFVSWISGRVDEGVAEARRALDADPLSAYAAAILAFALSAAGRNAEAIEPARLAVDRDPEAMLSHWILGQCYHGAGRFEEAIEAIETAATISGRQHYTVATQAVVFADWGKPAQAKALHEEIRARSSTEFVPRSLLAMSSAAAGDMDGAMRLAREGLEAREPGLVLFSRIYPAYQRVRDDPRFGEILRELKLPGLER